MNQSHRQCSASARAGGFSLLEMLVVMFIIALVMSILLPALERGRHRGKTAKCWNNLRQLGLSYQMFAHEHSDRFPMEVPTNQGGTLEFSRPPATVGAEFLDAFRHFQIASNDLQTPSLLICRTDTRLPAANFAVLQNEHISYFVSPDARYLKPTTVVAGDRNLVSSGLNTKSYVRIEPDATVAWTGDLHGFRGSLLLADNSVQDVGNTRLRAALNAASSGPIVILPPVREDEVGPLNPFLATAPDAANALRLEEAPPTAARAGAAPRAFSASAGTTPSGSEPGPQPPASDHKAALAAGAAPGVNRHLPNDADDVSPWDRWPANFARFLGTVGWQFTWLFLLLVLAGLIALEISRHRTRRKRSA